MRLKPDTAAFVVLLGALTSVGPLSTDIYLPSMPSIAATFGTTSAGAEATLTGYFFGFAIAQIIHGPISDRVGRRPVLLAGLALYALAGFACIFAPTIGLLIAARAVQAIAAAAPIILARTIVRDVHSGVRAGRLFSLIASITGLMPIVAPLLGGVLETHFGWKSSFIVMGLLGVVGFVVVGVAMPETIRQRSVAPLSLGSIFASFGQVAQNARFRAYAAMLSFAYGGFFVYIGVSSFIVQRYYGLSPVAYGLTFTLGAASFIAGTFLGRRIAHRSGLDYALGVGTALLAGGGLLLPAAMLLGPGTIPEFVIPMAVFQAGIGIVTPQGLAAAMTPFPERAGAASSLVGFLHMTTAALFLGLTGLFFGNHALLQACVIGGNGVAAFIVFLASRRLRAAV
jgi:DHA1 family bicyclomycin/chloramphenicol resistance-like MFS transporter